ncbi:hypothetical protein GGR54DRAFT_215253 [Hypoxylon sp. NC1633]|nr:hypothetical protein GGR54DRAFT_215253 [Hypoxylon sp. NC1633]
MAYPYQPPPYQPGHQPGYQPGCQPGYQPGYQPAYPSYQPAYQPTYPPTNQPTYQPFNTYYQPPPSNEGHPIYLYTTPLRYQSKYFHFKKPADAIGHWAVCIQGQCYEVTRNTDENKGKKDPKYIMRPIPVEEWTKERTPFKRDGPIGFTARPWPSATIERIAALVWTRSLKAKYVYDENNCQVFVRLLVELIGDPKTQAEFPASFDLWSKRAGLVRDSTTLIATAGMATVAAAASLAVTPGDFTGTAAAGFAISANVALRSSAALWGDRISKEKFIKKTQEELRAELRRDGVLPG